MKTISNKPKLEIKVSYPDGGSSYTVEKIIEENSAVIENSINDLFNKLNKDYE